MAKKKQTETPEQVQTKTPEQIVHSETQVVTFRTEWLPLQELLDKYEDSYSIYQDEIIINLMLNENRCNDKQKIEFITWKYREEQRKNK